MINVTVIQVKAALRKKGYKVFTGAEELNLVGIRTLPGEAGKFDDTLAVFYVDADGNEAFHLFAITTDPGRYYLNNPANVDGTAILKEGQYPVYQYALHRGAYMALCQRTGDVTVYRDRNKNNVIDYDNTDTGMFGINIHHAAKTGKTEFVGKFSAGCQVFQSIDDFNEVMELVRKQLRKYGNKFTYTLLNTNDIQDVPVTDEQLSTDEVSDVAGLPGKEKIDTGYAEKVEEQNTALLSDPPVLDPPDGRAGTSADADNPPKADKLDDPGKKGKNK